MNKTSLKGLALALAVVVTTVCSGCWWKVEGGGPRVISGSGHPHGGPPGHNKK